MEMSTESRNFFKLVELFGEHKAYDYKVSSYWNDDRQLVVYVSGREAEATIDFECNTNLDIELREAELAMLDRRITVPHNATDNDLRKAVEETINYLTN